jgi:Flp pilus assembly protein TadD
MVEETRAEGARGAQIIDPTPERRKHLTEVLYAFLNDKVSIAELKGIKRDELFRLSEAGFIKFKHGRLSEAEKIFQALIILDHRNGYFHAMMGAVHQKRGRPIEAIMEYSQAIKLAPKDIAAYVNRGELYLRHRNFRKAAEDFRSAILMDMSGANLWANRARSLVIAIKRSMEADTRKQAQRRR